MPLGELDECYSRLKVSEELLVFRFIPSLSRPQWKVIMALIRTPVLKCLDGSHECANHLRMLIRSAFWEYLSSVRIDSICRGLDNFQCFGYLHYSQHQPRLALSADIMGGVKIQANVGHLVVGSE